MAQAKVAIGIVVRGMEVIVCKRLAEAPMGDCWEFPGGKLLTGETPEEALHREIGEELGVQVRDLQPLPVIEHTYGELEVVLFPFLARLCEGEVPEPLASRELRWVAPERLRELKFPEANDGLVAQLPELIVQYCRA